MVRFAMLAPVAIACTATLGLAPAAASAHLTEGTSLRVVGPGGENLAERIQHSGIVHVETDPDAQCFGEGTGGSGDRVTIESPEAHVADHTPATALGAVQEASVTDDDLRPFSLTDAFDSGLRVCGIGGFQARGSASWYLKFNHAGAQAAGDRIAVREADEVLWYLAPSSPYPAELALEAPGFAPPARRHVRVTVTVYMDDGSSRPAVGAIVSAGAADVTTDTAGEALVPLDGRDVSLRATRGADIPSNEVSVCVARSKGKCAPQQLIVGTSVFNFIKGTEVADKIKARGYNDNVDARGGGPDRVNCGGGQHDYAVVDRNDTTKACENVKRA
jgi:hypothetical protein